MKVKRPKRGKARTIKRGSGMDTLSNGMPPNPRPASRGSMGDMSLAVTPPGDWNSKAN
jgi:hypothetical protein